MKPVWGDPISDDWWAWCSALLEAVDADNLEPDNPCAQSQTLRLLEAPLPSLREQAELARADLAMRGDQPFSAVRSDEVASRFQVRSDGALNALVARMTVPGGPWPGHYGLEAVVFTARDAVMADWFPPLPEPYALHFGDVKGESKGFAAGSGAVLFPEQLSVTTRPSTQAFGVVFLAKLADLFSVHVMRRVRRGALVAPGLPPDFPSADVLHLRETAFLAHEWGHAEIAVPGPTVVARRRRMIAVISEIQADTAALAMLARTRHCEAEAVASALILDRVIREAWLHNAPSQVDSIAARHLLHLLAEAGALGLRNGVPYLDVSAAWAGAEEETARLREVEAACAYDDDAPAREYLYAHGWSIDKDRCRHPLAQPVAGALELVASI